MGRPRLELDSDALARMVREGLSVTVIAARLEVAEPTVRRRLSELGIEVPRRAREPRAERETRPSRTRAPKPPKPPRPPRAPRALATPVGQPTAASLERSAAEQRRLQGLERGQDRYRVCTGCQLPDDVRLGAFQTSKSGVTCHRCDAPLTAGVVVLVGFRH